MMKTNISILTTRLVREDVKDYCIDTIKEPSDFVTLLNNVYHLGEADRECLVVVHLSVRMEVNGINLVSVGSMTEAIAHPREVFKAAILNNSRSIVLIHNHPSGDIKPSAEDKKLTKRFTEAGKLLGIPIRDHIIIAGDGYFSFKENGLIE